MYKSALLEKVHLPMQDGRFTMLEASVLAQLHFPQEGFQLSAGTLAFVDCLLHLYQLEILAALQTVV